LLSPSYQFGPFRLDGTKRVLWRGEAVVPLPPKALQVLLVLVEQRGDVVQRDELMSRVWPDTAVEEANLSVNIHALRKVLGRQNDGRPYIETLSRRGYRFLAALQRVPGSTVPSLAVLPFRPLVPGAEDDGLGLAMADALITRLSSTGKIAVRPTSAVLKYAAAGTEPLPAGRELRVDAVLEGRFQRQENRLRLTVQLVPMSDTGPAWASRFEEDVTHLFAVQDALAEQLASALSLELSDQERKLLTHHPTEHVGAYQDYVRGRHFWNRFTREGLQKAYHYFQEALTKDPGYARAYVGQASVYLVLGVSGFMPPREAWRLAEEAVNRAFVLDGAVSEAHLVRAFVRLFQNWDWQGAERDMKRALALGPFAASSHSYSALFFVLAGRFEDAQPRIEQAGALDPVSLMAHALRGMPWTLMHRDDRALVEYQGAVDLQPNHYLGRWGTAVSLLSRHRPDEAVAEMRKAVVLANDALVMKAELAWVLAAAKRPEEARQLVAELKELSRTERVSSYQLAFVLAWLKENDEALEYLARAAEERDPWLLMLRVDPRLDRLREDPRFMAIRRRIDAGPHAS